MVFFRNNRDLYKLTLIKDKVSYNTVLSKNGAHVITESIGEIQASPSATPFRLLLMVPAFCAYYKIEISKNTI